MNDEVAAPVRGMINAFRRGISQSQRICQFAQKSSATYMLDTLRPAQGLEKSLIKSEARVKDAYSQSIEVFGRPYADAFGYNNGTTNRLHALTINLLEQLNGLDEYTFDPASFDLGSFPYLQRESERCCDQALIALRGLHQELVKARLQKFQIAQNDRAPIPSSHRGIERVAAGNRPLSEVSPMSEIPTLGLGILFSPATAESKYASSPLQREVLITSSNSRSQDEKQEPLVLQVEVQADLSLESGQDVTAPEALKPVELKDKAMSEENEGHLIKKEEVNKHISAIEDFLEKRKIRKQTFRDELNRISMISNTISPTSPQPSFTVSPLQRTPPLIQSPIMNSRPNSTLLATIMETPSSAVPPVPPKDDPWTSSSPLKGEDSAKTLTNEVDEPRKDSETLGSPKPNILPVTPPESVRRQSDNGEWSSLPIVQEQEEAGIVNKAGYGEGVEGGLEVVGLTLVSDPGLILVDESHKVLTPAASEEFVDHAMRHDCSFFKYGGFCDGAKMSLRGAAGTMKEFKRPGGMYTDVMVMKCIICSFEVNYNDFHRDQRLNKAGTIKPPGFDDIEYRTRFLIKSHMKTEQSDSPNFACMFCVEESKTLEDQDATVFFSASQLLSHVQKHPRRLKEVEGMKVVYGPLPENDVNFDVHFLTMDAKVSPTADIRLQIASGGKGYALINHRPGTVGFKAIDPERRPTLRFAVGARIVGISFPASLQGDWCTGYHDSVKALFPSSAVQLDPPSKDDVMMNQKSFLTATARWNYRPKDHSGGWLSFSKKDRITHIAYPYQEFWCWSGMSSRGKWGIFPKDFVDGLVDTSDSAEPALGPGGFRTSPPPSFGSVRFPLNLGNHGAKKEPDQHSSTVKRKTTGFSFGRRSVKSHANGGNSEHSHGHSGLERTL